MFVFEPIPGAKYKYDYAKIAADMEQARLAGASGEVRRHLRHWGREDLFFLLYFLLGVKGVNHPWVVDRINEVEEINDRTIDLWAREHFKSTIITWALNIQTVIRNPEERIGIFSHTRTLAKAHLRRIKQALETNKLLTGAFDDVFWENPTSQAPKWSEDDGLIVKRRGTFLESTFEAWGVVDGMPTGKHFTVLNYDDLVTVESVSTPDQLKKVRECFGLSLNLGVRDGKKRLIGTRYHFNDLYATCKDQGLWIVRERPAEDPETKEPVMLTAEELEERYTTQGPYNYNCLAEGTKILMGDWTLKNIEDVRVGDVVVGIERGANGSKTKLSPATVLAARKMMGDVQAVKLASGRTVYCTPNHRWWSGRWPSDKEPNRKAYNHVGFKKGDLHSLCRILDNLDGPFRDAVVEIIQQGQAFVYNIQTTTGNYIADGYVSSNSQMLLNPVADELQEFKSDWVRYYNSLPSPLNVFLLVDPAHSKKKDSDYTVLAVLGIDRLGNHFLVDMRRKRMNLRERWEALRDLIVKYPQVQRVGYEQYGLQADIQYIEQMQEEEGIHFSIRPLGGKVGKVERIKRLVPLFSAGKFFLPRNPIMEGDKNLVKSFLEEEYALFPFARHDDMLDAIARICDDAMGAQRPIMAPEEGRRYRRQRTAGTTNWAI